MSDRKLNMINHFLGYLDKERGYSPHTIKAYRTDLLQFCDFLNNYFGYITSDFGRVDKTSAKHFLNYLMEKRFSPRSVARKLATLKAFFKFLVRSEEITVNPISSIKAPKISKRLPSFLEEGVIAKLLEVPSSETWEGLRDRAILELFYSTGMRLSELVNLSIANVNFSDNLVRVIGKGNKERIIPFGDMAKHAIITYIEKREVEFGKSKSDNPLFISKRGKRISPRTIQDRLKKYFETLSKGTHFSPHLVRHTFATHLLDRGMDIRAVKELLGHASLSSTQIYTHLRIEQMKKVFKQSHPHA